MNFKEWLDKQIFLENESNRQILDCLIRLKGSDPNCWERFYNHFQPFLLNFLKTKTRHYEDVSQLVWKQLLVRFQNIRIHNCKPNRSGVKCNKEYDKLINNLSKHIEAYLTSSALNKLRTFYHANKRGSMYRPNTDELDYGTDFLQQIPNRGTLNVIATRKEKNPRNVGRVYRMHDDGEFLQASQKSQENASNLNEKIRKVLDKIEIGEIKTPSFGKIPMHIIIYAFKLKYGLEKSREPKKSHGNISMKSNDITNEIKEKFGISINNITMRGTMARFEKYLGSIL